MFASDVDLGKIVVVVGIAVGLLDDVEERMYRLSERVPHLSGIAEDWQEQKQDRDKKSFFIRTPFVR